MKQHPFALPRPLPSLAAVLLALPLAAHSYLGGFELGDGYGLPGAVFLAPTELAKYNAGQYGSNHGGPGGSASTLADGTGLWYGISGTRYPSNSTQTGITAYATAHQGFDRLAHGTTTQALVLTTNSDGWSGPTLEYGYRLDARDLNGTTPAQTAGSTVNISFWWCPLIPGLGEGGGLGAGTVGDTIKFVDSAGNIGFTVGLVQPGLGVDYVGYNNGGGFNAAPQNIAGNSSRFSKWDITLDFAAQTVSAIYLDGVGGPQYTVLSNASLAANMSDLSELHFASTPGVNNAKLLALDDFNFQVTSVPEPASLALVALALGALPLCRRPGLGQAHKRGQS